MDPAACYRAMIDAMDAKDFEDARQRALDLQSWLRRGGAYPRDHYVIAVNQNLARVLKDTSHVQLD